MGASGREFLHFRMERSEWEDIPPEHREPFFIDRVEIEGEKYPEDERWVDLKRASTKAYKALKNYEYDKRHNFRNR